MQSAAQLRENPVGMGISMGFGGVNSRSLVTWLTEQSNTGRRAWKALTAAGVFMGPISTPAPEEIGSGNGRVSAAAGSQAWGRLWVLRDERGGEGCRSPSTSE